MSETQGTEDNASDITKPHKKRGMYGIKSYEKLSSMQIHGIRRIEITAHHLLVRSTIPLYRLRLIKPFITEGRSPSVERSPVQPSEVKRIRKASESSCSSPAVKHVNFKIEPETPEHFARQKEESQGEDFFSGEKSQNRDIEKGQEDHEEYRTPERERLPPEGENLTDLERKEEDSVFQDENRDCVDELEQKSRSDSVSQHGMSSGDEVYVYKVVVA